MTAREALRNPVLRVLGTSTLIGTLGRGVFLSVTVLYFNYIVGLTAGQISIIVAASSATGIVTSVLAGQLSDRFSARWVLLTALVIESVALVSYSFVSTFWMAVVVACVALGSETGAHSARSAIIARAFDGAIRVTARAVLRTLTNIGIAIGSGAGGLALLIGTAEAYRAILVAAGLVYFGAGLLTLRLPARVDAPGTSTPTDDLPIDASSLAGADEDLGDAGEPAVAAAKPSRWAHSPWHDGRYLLFSALAGIFAIQFGLLEVGVPLWVAHDTQAPKAIVSALLILNTVIVIAFQVPLSRGTHDLRVAGRVVGIAGVLMAAACFIYAGANGLPPIWAAAVLIIAGTAHAFAEVFSQAGSFGLSYELADPVSAGAYQGVGGTFYSISSTVAPLIVTATALTLGLAGWAILAAMFLLSAFGITAVAWRAAARAGVPSSGRDV